MHVSGPLNDRISVFNESYELLGEEQAGFRSGYSTMDHVFSLHAILDWYLKRRKRVYTAFVEYRKAFDLIDRSSLWLKLINHGVDGTLLKTIRQIYDKSKSCISYKGTTSDFFQTNIGVKQGENLSPLLFALYINDFEGYLQQKYKGLETFSTSVNETFSDCELGFILQIIHLVIRR